MAGDDGDGKITKLAEYTSTCEVCCQRIDPGQVIVYLRDEDEWVHEECADES